MPIDFIKLHVDIKSEQATLEESVAAAKVVLDAAQTAYDIVNARLRYVRQAKENLAVLPEVAADEKRKTDEAQAAALAGQGK